MKWYEKGILCLVLYSVAMFFVEMELGGQSSLHGPAFFLWSERLVAMLLTLEVLTRLVLHSSYTKIGTNSDYFKSPEIAFDLVAVVPFWMGFLASEPETLALIRSMRILRLLKFYRASPVAHDVMHSLIAQRLKIRLVGSMILITVLFSGTAMYHLEATAQPEVFGTLWKSLWWAVVTMTTVGFGDMYPITKAGQSVAMALMLGPGIAIVGALFGIMSTAFDSSRDNGD